MCTTYGRAAMNPSQHSCAATGSTTQHVLAVSSLRHSTKLINPLKSSIFATCHYQALPVWSC
jgi:hypothetical protein